MFKESRVTAWTFSNKCCHEEKGYMHVIRFLNHLRELVNYLKKKQTLIIYLGIKEIKRKFIVL